MIMITIMLLTIIMMMIAAFEKGAKVGGGFVANSRSKNLAFRDFHSSIFLISDDILYL